MHSVVTGEKKKKNKKKKGGKGRSAANVLREIAASETLLPPSF